MVLLVLRKECRRERKDKISGGREGAGGKGNIKKKGVCGL